VAVLIWVTKKYNIKTSGDYKSLDEIKNTIVSSVNGKSVYVKDIADVSFDYGRTELHSKT
jgi:Cu/Ag efflux pump CusA